MEFLISFSAAVQHLQRVFLIQGGYCDDFEAMPEPRNCLNKFLIVSWSAVSDALYLATQKSWS